MNDSIVLGVDIGGSHITAMLVDLENKNNIENSEVRETVNANGNANDIISLWSSVIDRGFSNQNIEIKKIGIAMPGPFDYKEGIAWMKNQDKYDSLYGLNIKTLLAEKVGIPSGNIRFINDAESFLKGEVFSGAAKEAGTALGLTLGTGLGSASYRNGKVKDANLWSSPFLDGIAEDYLSTRWFVSNYFALTGKTLNGVKELAALANDEKAVAGIFKEFAHNLALFLKGHIDEGKPEAIILGGNIAKAFPLFSEELDRQLAIPGKPVIKQAVLGEKASLIGAASCWAKAEEKTLQTIRA